MPTLHFLKKKRTKDSSSGSKDLASPTSTTSQPNSPTTPTSTRDFGESIDTVSTASTSGTHQSQEVPHPVPASEGVNQSAKEVQPMTEGSTPQHPISISSVSSAAPATTEQQNLPTISNIVNPPQHDGASQSVTAQMPDGDITVPKEKVDSKFGQEYSQPTQRSAWTVPTQQPEYSQPMLETARPMQTIQAPQPAPYAGQNVPQQQPQIRQTKGKYSLGDFDILRTLGTGSFGRVHLVQSKHNQRFYAVKVLKKQQVVKMKQVEHTNDERRMLQEVKHPFLITLWGTFSDCKNLYMVMDFVEGGELFSLLRKSQVSGFYIGMMCADEY